MPNSVLPLTLSVKVHPPAVTADTCKCMGRSGRSETFMTGRGGVIPSGTDSAKCYSTIAAITVISVMARCCPKQTRGPAPKGR
jgi:hypothetical protein